MEAIINHIKFSHNRYCDKYCIILLHFLNYSIYIKSKEGKIEIAGTISKECRKNVFFFGGGQ